MWKFKQKIAHVNRKTNTWHVNDKVQNPEYVLEIEENLTIKVNEKEKSKCMTNLKKEIDTFSMEKFRRLSK